MLANSDDLTIASSTTVTDRHSSKDSTGREDEQKPTNVQQFRDTISRALYTHLEMASSMTCCCSSTVTACSCDASGMATSSCCVSSCNENKNVVTCNHLEHGTNGVVAVDNHQQHMNNTSCQNVCSCNSTTNFNVGLVFYIYIFLSTIFPKLGKLFNFSHFHFSTIQSSYKFLIKINTLVKKSEKTVEA